jgi:hypothetical protein
MYIAIASLLLVPCLLARQGSGSRWIWLGGGGVFLLVFALGTTFALFGGEQARVPLGAFHAMTEMLIGVRTWTFIGALGFALAGFSYKQEPESHGVLGK